MRKLSPRSEVRNFALRAWNRMQGNLPIPPAELIFLAAGSEDVSWFLKAGAWGAQSILDILQKHGLSLADVSPILDFGCGCGRIMRHWKSLQEVELYGTDYNLRLINWCRVELPFAHFQTNELCGRLDYADNKFGFIYALSVFTHLTEEQQFFWIGELFRILRPGGYLLITVHGEHYLNILPPQEQEQFRLGRLVILGEEYAGTNMCAAFHPEQYVREKLARGWNVVDFIPEGARGNPSQDLFLLRKPTAS